MKILIVEDEPKMAQHLALGFREAGYVVDSAHDGNSGLHYAETGAFDLIILDLMLPARTGWSVLSTLRGKKITTPILILTALDAVADRIRGLEAGADDYLTKPFAFAELLARARSILRRPPNRQSDVLRIVDLEIDIHAHRALRAGKPLDLTPKEFALLELLVRRAGDVVTRSDITSAIWDMNFDSFTNVVDVHVRRLRAKLDDPFSIKLIRTIRGVGYAIDQSA